MKISKLIFYIITLLAGALAGYVASQYSYFKINTEINVIETIIALISIGVGIYIAVTIQRRYNQNQNLYNYLVNRFESLWADFNSFRILIESNDKIELNKVLVFIKNFQRKNSDLNRLLLIDAKSTKNYLEKLTDELQHLFENSLIRHNVVYYDGTKDAIIEKADSISTCFVEIYKGMNKV